MIWRRCRSPAPVENPQIFATRSRAVMPLTMPEWSPSTSSTSAGVSSRSKSICSCGLPGFMGSLRFGFHGLDQGAGLADVQFIEHGIHALADAVAERARIPDAGLDERALVQRRDHIRRQFQPAHQAAQVIL